jgi:RNA polymerase sigma-70 factor (ECF subfamily)
MDSRKEPGDLTSSLDLIHRAHGGDRRALDRLFERYLHPLRRWTTGRLPRWARDLTDTDDMIQEGQPPRGEIQPTAADPGASPFEETLGREAAERYEAALARLKEAEREAVIARVELGLDYEGIAEALGKPSPDAARMAVVRALVRLAQEMGHGS